LAALYVAGDDSSWELRARTADLNRDATTEEPNHTVAAFSTKLDSVDLLYRRALFGGRVTAGAGFERGETASLSFSEEEWRVSAEWIKDL
jgi:hypothetical protein